MSVGTEWPEHTPELDITVQVNASNLLSLASGSQVANYARFSPGTGLDSGLVASVWKNGAWAGVVSVDRTTGALSMSALAVSAGDVVEIRVEYLGQLSKPWYCRVRLRRSALVEVAGGAQSVTFDGSTNVMPAPSWDCAFGWDGGDKLKLGFDIADDDGATEQMSVTTRLLGVADDEDSTSSVDLSSAGTPTQVSDFTSSQVLDEFQVELVLRSDSGLPRQEDRHVLIFADAHRVGGYPGAFPSSGAMLGQTKPAGSTAPELDVF